MSNLEQRPAEVVCGSDGDPGPALDLLPGHEVALGGARAMTVTRTLPNRGRRLVGAWCFADAYGPTDLRTSPGMVVPPHPHTALQTVSWLLEGAVLHRDSVGSEQVIRPGQLNLMTAGRGIAHSEESVPAPTPYLHGAQLWVALPGSSVGVQPHFEHHAELPVWRSGGVEVTLLMGSFGDLTSPARTYTPLVGADVSLAAGASATLPLDPSFEHGLICLQGTIRGDAAELSPGPLLYLGTGRSSLSVGASASGPARVVLLGGEPFAEDLVMWWNFVGRSHDDVVAARTEWEAGADRFGVVHGFDGPRLAAPALPSVRLRPRGRER